MWFKVQNSRKEYPLPHESQLVWPIKKSSTNLSKVQPTQTGTMQVSKYVSSTSPSSEKNTFSWYNLVFQLILIQIIYNVLHVFANPILQTNEVCVEHDS